MACGTPVVAYRRGSMPEVVDEGVTGYPGRRRGVGASRAVDGARRALDRAGPCAARGARFGADRMVEDYLRVYETLLVR